MTYTHLLTHMDLDGAACAILFLLVEPEAHVEFHDHKSINAAVRKVLHSGDPVLMADICPNEETLRWANKKYPAQIAIYDHHASAPWATLHRELRISGDFNDSVCGARVLAGMLEPKLREKLDGGQAAAVDWLLDATQARDLWRQDASGWHDGCLLTQLVKYMGVARFVDWAVPRLQNNEMLLPPGLRQILQARMDKDIETAQGIAENSRRAVDAEGRVYYWTVSSGLASEIGHSILKTFKDAEYAAIMLPVYQSVELRADNGVHVGEIGKSRGGGGHPNAAGYPVLTEDLPAELSRMLRERTDGVAIQ